jgi:DNA polymerase I-like protein with 3'-5' exonuclease and polymerase domains
MAKKVLTEPIVREPAWAEGRSDAPFLFVLTHRPTEGMRAWFWQKLLDCGIDKVDCRFVYMLDSPPQGAGNKLIKEQTRSSWNRFAMEIRDSTPSVVIPLGSDALYVVTGIREDIFNSRGYVITKKFFRPAVHDAYIQTGVYKAKSKVTGAQKGDPKMAWKEIVAEPLLGNDFSGTVIPMFQLDHIRTEGFAVTAAVNADLLRARRAFDDELDLIDTTFTYETSLSQKLSAHAWGSVVAVDIETHGIDNEVIDCVSVSDGIESATLKWSLPVREFISRLFLDAINANRIVALHNSPFDLPRLAQAGVIVPESFLEHHVFDTMFGGVVLQPDLLKGLGAMAPVYLDTHPWKWDMLSSADPEFYSAKDAFVTAKLATVLISIMKDLGTWNLFMGQGKHPGPGVMATLPMLTENSREGINIDRAAAVVWCRRLERHGLRLMKMWCRLFPTVSPSSPRDLRTLFYTEWDLPPQKTREDGISTDELACMRLREYTKQFATIESAADEGWRKDSRFSPRVFDLLLALRDISKKLGTYAQPVAESMTTRVHPQYLPAAKDNDRRTASKGNTATGRLAAYRPNIQNQPKRARWLYIPDSPDMCFVQGDFVRAEPYVMAYKAQDRNMIADLLSGDLYLSLLDRLTAMGYKGLTRKTCKNVFLAGQYLAGASKVSEMILKQDHTFIDVDTCREVLRGIATAYSDVAAYKRYLVMQCETKQYIRNPFGRVRFFYDGRGPAAVDFIPQSTVADILWCVLLEVAKVARSLGGRFILTVHDSILVQVPQHHVAKMVSEMRRIMSRTFDCVTSGFCIPVEFEAAGPGESWGAVKAYKEAA